MSRVSLGDLLNMQFEQETKPKGKRANGVAPVAINPLAAATEVTALASAETARSMLAIALIRLDGDTQPRGGLNEERVQEYERALDEGEELPPVEVVFDGEFYWTWDGFHRIEGSKRRGRTEIAVRITRGTLSDAQWLSYSANKKHGLNRTSEDKARAVQRALRHPKGALLSNREIARHCGVDEKTVRNYREKMEASAEIPQIEQRRIVRGGQSYKQDTGNIGSRQKQNTPVSAENPQIGNRKVDSGDARPRRYVLPSEVSPVTSPSEQPAASGQTLPRQAEATQTPPGQYAPVFLLEQRVWSAVRWVGVHYPQVDALAEMRELTEWSVRGESTTGQAIRDGLHDLQWRDEDLGAAITKVIVLLEQNEKETTQALGAAPEFKQETLTQAAAKPLTHPERQAAIGRQIEYWQGALARLALVGELTGQHSVTLGLRREIDKVIALYKQEQGV